jgi:hypothetical protein
MRNRAAAWVAACALVALAACSREPVEPVKITGVDLSHEIAANNEPRSARETFAPSSTVYAAIATEGSGPATLAAKWTDASGKVLADQNQSINPTKPQRFEFHLDPDGDWALGRYKVVITLNGAAPRSREFEIR